MRSNLIVFADPQSTVSNIATNQTLFRLGIVSYLLSELLFFLLALTLFRLFREISKFWATVLLAAALITVAIAVANSLNSIAALVLLSRTDYVSAFPADQTTGLVIVFLRLNNHGQGLLELFWLPFFFSIGWLFYQSRAVPRLLGVFLMVGSFGFPIHTFSRLIAPEATPAIILQITQVLMGLGAIPSILWLLIRGMKPIAEDRGLKI